MLLRNTKVNQVLQMSCSGGPAAVKPQPQAGPPCSHRNHSSIHAERPWEYQTVMRQGHAHAVATSPVAILGLETPSQPTGARVQEVEGDIKQH